jgi:hypothetical protein
MMQTRDQIGCIRFTRSGLRCEMLRLCAMNDSRRRNLRGANAISATHARAAHVAPPPKHLPL